MSDKPAGDTGKGQEPQKAGSQETVNNLITYRIVGYTQSDVRAAVFELVTRNPDWPSQVREIQSRMRDFVLAAVILERKFQAPSNGEGPAAFDHLVIGFEIGPWRTTMYRVLAHTPEQALEAVAKRYPHPNQHIVCGTFPAATSIVLCTNLGYYELERPLYHITAPLPGYAAADEVQRLTA
jgi:hypothetical protein